MSELFQKLNAISQTDKVADSENKAEVVKETPVKTETKSEEIKKPEEKVEEKPIKEKKIIRSVYGEHVIETDDPETIDTPEKFFEIVKKKTGQQVTAYDDILKIIEGSDKVSKTDYEKTKIELEEYETFLKTLPTEVSAILSDVYNKRDYRETLKKIVGQVDYSKPVSAYTKEELILLNNPDMGKDEVEELDEKVVNTLYKAAKSVYEIEHSKINAKAEEMKNAKFDNAKKFYSSIETAMEKLTKDMPNLSETQKKSVKEKMLTGYNLFDGMKYREDAGIKIAHAEFGRDFIQEVINNSAKQTQRKIEQEKSNLKEEMLKEKNNDDLRKSSVVLPQQNIAEALQKDVPFLKPSKKK